MKLSKELKEAIARNNGYAFAVLRDLEQRATLSPVAARIWTPVYHEARAWAERVTGTPAADRVSGRV